MPICGIGERVIIVCTGVTECIGLMVGKVVIAPTAPGVGSGAGLVRVVVKSTTSWNLAIISHICLNRTSDGVRKPELHTQLNFFKVESFIPRAGSSMPITHTP